MMVTLLLPKKRYYTVYGKYERHSDTVWYI